MSSDGGAVWKEFDLRRQRSTVSERKARTKRVRTSFSLVELTSGA